MKMSGMKKAIGLLASACMTFQLVGGMGSDVLNFSSQKTNAITNFSNASVSSQGSKKEDAVIRGGSAQVVHDSARKSDVLSLNGDAFGDGWLQLPSLFGDGVDDGFTVSMQFCLAEDAENYTRLFQFSSIPFGTGNAPSYSSPDISVDLCDMNSYRASIFVGKTSATVDDDAHRSIFNLQSKPDTGTWHHLCAVYSTTGAEYYLDGSLLAITEAENLSATMKNLFGEKVLSSYTYNAIGHSLYTDHDIRAKFDDIAFYDYALTKAQVSDLPSDAAYLYTFEEDTLTEGDPTAAPETTISLSGAALTSIPSLQITSPDKTLTTKIWVDNKGSYYYSVDKFSDGKTGTVIQPSKLGLTTTTEDLSSGFSQTAPTATRTYVDQTYTMPNGKHCEIRDNYHEMSFPLIKGDSVLTVFVRVYDDGMGFRYALNHGADIKSEQSEVVFPENGTFWGSGPNATYEWEIGEFNTQKMNDAWADYSVPLLGNINNRYWVLLSEASVFNEENPYCAGYLRTVGGSRALTWRTGIKVEGVSMSGAFHTPWRAAVITDNLNDLSGSDLIQNLNPPSVLEDTSWVRPGKVAWSWWSSGGDSPIEYHTQKDYIDFAAENGWDYVCLDFGWALWDDSAAKVRELCEYGAERGIGIYLWYGVNNKGHSGYKDSAGNPAYPYYSLLDEATIVREFERISGLGVQGVKVDYYESDTQETMKQMHLCAEVAAKNKLMVLFHGCTMPRGESRTYPHVISYEAVNGTEFYKWFESPSLTNRITYTYLRNVVGSADFTPTGVPIPGIAATAGFALADVVNIESGVQHFAQSVYTYEGSTALAFLNDVPVKWDDLYIVDGHPLKFNVTARRSGKDWYVGAATIDARKIEIPLGEFITDDGTYNAYIFGDNADGSAIEVKQLTGLTKDSVITHDLMKNGGCAIKITKGSMKLTTPYSNYKFYEAEHAALSGEAKASEGKYCSNNAYVGYVGGSSNNHVTFKNVKVDEAGEYVLRIYYISGETRSLDVTVNGAHAATLNGLFANRNDWKGICAVNTTVKLNAGENVIKLHNDSKYAPSIDRIAIAIPMDESLIPGDLNFDGVVNSFDVALMKRGLLNEYQNAKQEKAADYNQNGKVEIIDLIAMVQFVLGA